jgi:hypothetical protein
VVDLLAPLQVDQLHALPNVIRAEVTLGIRCGAAAVLASVQLRSGIHLVGLEPGFSATASAMTRQATLLNFTRFGRVIVVDMDVDGILRRGGPGSGWSVAD